MISIFSRANNSIVGAGWILSIAALASAVLGLFRTRLLLDLYGVGIETDIYNFAFIIPDLVYFLLISGAISAAFIPVFIGYLGKDEKEAWRVAQSFFLTAVLSVIFIAAILFLFMPYLVDFFARGFDEQAKESAVLLSRIMLLSPIFFGIGAVFSGILQSKRQFLVCALAPLLYNLGIIIGILFFTKFWGIEGLAWGVAFGALIQMLIQAPFVFKAGFSFANFRFAKQAVQRIIKLMIPRSFSLGAQQINILVITSLASTISAGSITIFINSYNVNMLLVGVIGVSFATALFPEMSEAYSKKDFKRYLSSFSHIFRGILFLVLPSSVAMFVLREHIIRLIYGVDMVTWDDTRLMAASLGLLSFGVFAYSLSPVFVRAFYAMRDTKTPLFASLLGVVSNIALSAAFLFIIFPKTEFLSFLADKLSVSNVEASEVLALPLAFFISGIISFLAVFISFARAGRKHNFIVSDLVSSGLKILAASLAAGFISWGAARLLEGAISSTTFLSVLAQTVIVFLVYGVVYLSISYSFKFKETSVINSLFSRFFNKKKYEKQH